MVGITSVDGPLLALQIVENENEGDLDRETEKEDIGMADGLEAALHGITDLIGIEESLIVIGLINMARQQTILQIAMENHPQIALIVL